MPVSGSIARLRSRARARIRARRRARVPESAYRVDKPSLRRWLPPDPVIVEAGAHIGTDTAEFAEIWPNGRILAFEPIPELFAQLEARVEGLPNVETEATALGARTGTMTMWVSGGESDGSSSLSPPTGHLDEHPGVTFERTLEVPVVTLDQWAEDRGVKRIDFLWLDMQGHELAALNAAPRLVDTLSVIVLEVFLKEQYEDAPLWPEVRAWLEGHGFRIEAELLPWPDGGNVVAVRDQDRAGAPRDPAESRSLGSSG